MALNIAGISFDGPYSSVASLLDRSGVYVIVDSVAGEYRPVDCGESATVRSRVAWHDRSSCWHRNCDGTLMFAVHYTPTLQNHGRWQIESKIRSQYSFPCGVN